jgi:hypothetical protein
MTSTRHKWGERIEVSPHKSERECSRCEVVMVSRHEREGGREVHWKEFWRDCERIECEARPPCDARREKQAGEKGKTWTRSELAITP